MSTVLSITAAKRPMIMELNVISPTEYKSILFRALVLLLIAYRSFKSKSLTQSGIIASLITGFIHSLPETNLYLILILTFYLTSSRASKYKEEIKSKKTRSFVQKGTDPTSQSQRTHVQVLANSITATILILFSTITYDHEVLTLLKVGIIGQYVAVQADTWSSELGILSTSEPFLITTFESVPPGTNGGVTNVGLLAGISGSALLSAIAAFTYKDRQLEHFIYFTILGVVGTLIDSILGAFLQVSIVDRNGLVLEPMGGAKLSEDILRKEKDNLKRVAGEDILSNNQVNVAMALITSLLSIGLYRVVF